MLLVRLAGRGGQAELYEAVDRGGERWAIKVLRGDAAWRAFGREQRIGAALRHEAVLRAVDTSDACGGGPAWIRYPWAEHGDASHAAWSLSPGGYVRVALRLLGALAAAHAHGIVHGDVKAENVLVFSDPGGDDVDVRLADFGVHLEAPELETAYARHAWGTPGHCAPEQRGGGLREAGPWTDIYGLGRWLLRLAEDQAQARPDERWTPLLAWATRLAGEDVQGRPRSASEAGSLLLASCADPRHDSFAARLGLGQEGLRRTWMTLLAPPELGQGGSESDEPFSRGPRGGLLRRLAHDVFASVDGERGHWVHVVAEPGAGATTLLRRLARLTLRAGSPLLLEGSPLPYVRGSCLADALHKHLRLDGLLPFEIRQCVQAWGERIGAGDAEWLRGLVEHFVSLYMADPHGLGAGAPGPRLAAMSFLAQRSPVLLLVDGLRGGTLAEEELGGLGRVVASTGVRLLVVSVGPDPAPAADRQELMPPMTAEEAESMVRARSPGLAEPEMQGLVAWSGGHPGLLEEALSTFGRGDVRRVCAAPRASEARVASTLDALPDDERGLWIIRALDRARRCRALDVVLAQEGGIPWLRIDHEGVGWRREAEREAVLRWGSAHRDAPWLRRAVAAHERHLDEQGKLEAAVLEGHASKAASMAVTMARAAFDRGDRWRARFLLVKVDSVAPDEVHERWEEVERRLMLANLERLDGRLEAAMERLEGFAPALEGAPPRLVAMHSFAWAQIHARRSRFAEAESWAERAAASLDADAGPSLYGQVLWLRGSLKRRQGYLDEAAELLGQAVDLLGTLPPGHALGVACAALGHVRQRQGKMREALALWNRASDIFESRGLLAEQAGIRLALGDLHRRDRDLVSAQRMYESAGRLFEAVGSESVILARLNLALTHLDAGDPYACQDRLRPLGWEDLLVRHPSWGAWRLLLGSVAELQVAGPGAICAAYAASVHESRVQVDRDDEDFVRLHELLMAGLARAEEGGVQG